MKISVFLFPINQFYPMTRNQFLITGLISTLMLSQSCKPNPQAVTPLKAEKICEIKTKLGEGSVWDHQKQVLYWIDIEDGILFEYDPVLNTNKSHNAGKKIGAIVPESENTVVMALQDGIYRMNLLNDSLEFLSKPASLLENQRFNDGKCDPQGRFWVGSIGADKSCFLYCLNNDGKIAERLDGITISNGIIWSPDSTKMYYTDTKTQKVKQFTFDGDSGKISDEKTIITVPDSLGSPDGMTIDAEGKLWIAFWRGHAVYRYDPETGTMMQKIDVPAKNITSCAFGGKDLETLYITSSSLDMTDEEHILMPDAGALFMVKPGVKGINANFFKSSK
jgi:sugar lactone lactonase YvrE